MSARSLIIAALIGFASAAVLLLLLWPRTKTPDNVVVDPGEITAAAKLVVTERTQAYSVHVETSRRWTNARIFVSWVAHYDLGVNFAAGHELFPLGVSVGSDGVAYRPPGTQWPLRRA